MSVRERLRRYLALAAGVFVVPIGCSENEVEVTVIYPIAGVVCTSGTDMRMAYVVSGGSPWFTSNTLTYDGVSRPLHGSWLDTGASGEVWSKQPLLYEEYGDSCRIILCWNEAWDIYSEEKCASSETFTIMQHPPYIRFTYSRHGGGDGLTVGEIDTICWESYRRDGRPVKIELLDTTFRLERTIAASTPDDSQFEWTVDSLPGAHYVHIAGVGDTLSDTVRIWIWSTTDIQFYPWFSYDTLAAGDSTYISWYSYGAANLFVRIQLLDSLAQPQHTIADSTPDNTRYLWVVDTLPGLHYLEVARLSDSVCRVSPPFWIVGQ
jgi:hypothetical protein